MCGWWVGESVGESFRGRWSDKAGRVKGGVETGVKRSKGRINVFPWQPRQKRSLLRWLLWKSWRVCVCGPPAIVARTPRLRPSCPSPPYTTHERQGGTGRNREAQDQGGTRSRTWHSDKPGITSATKTDPVTLAIFWWLTFWNFFHVIVIIVGWPFMVYLGNILVQRFFFFFGGGVVCSSLKKSWTWNINKWLFIELSDNLFVYWPHRKRTEKKKEQTWKVGIWDWVSWLNCCQEPQRRVVGGLVSVKRRCLENIGV